MSDRATLAAASWGEAYTITAIAGGENHEFTAVVAPALHPSLHSLWNTTIPDDYTKQTIANTIVQLGMTMGD